jgi:uncharacterized protein YecE (DUF72 family)
MSKADCDIRIGTSGWYYNHWKELFYPAGLPKSKWFEHYAQHFDTVEINNTFYQLPKEQSLKRWHKLAPKGFLYAVKANRYITHIKRLKDTSEELERFFKALGIYVYFNNDAHAHAIKNAKQLKQQFYILSSAAR